MGEMEAAREEEYFRKLVSLVQNKISGRFWIKPQLEWSAVGNMSVCEGTGNFGMLCIENLDYIYAYQICVSDKSYHLVAS